MFGLLELMVLHLLHERAKGNHRGGCFFFLLVEKTSKGVRGGTSHQPPAVVGLCSPTTYTKNGAFLLVEKTSKGGAPAITPQAVVGVCSPTT